MGNNVRFKMLVTFILLFLFQSCSRMLEKHPKLRFVAAHLASLEWNVDELAKRLDKYPNIALDMAERICHLQFQAVRDWQKVQIRFCRSKQKVS